MSDNITKRVGLGTAYGFAKAGGYEGTVAEFTELLGNIAIDLARIENLSVTVTTLPAGSQATASLNGSVLSLGIPKGDTGATGATGETGAPAGFGTVSATVDDTIGTPSVEVTASGADTAKNFAFAFHNLKGQKGDKGDTGEVSEAELTQAFEDFSANGTVANAEQLTTDIRANDQTPYLFRTAGGSVDIGDREYINGIVGGTIAWNQFISNGDFASVAGWGQPTGVDSWSVSDGVATINAKNMSDNTMLSRNAFPFIENHIYLFTAEMKLEEAMEGTVAVFSSYPSMFSGYSNLASTTWAEYSTIRKATSNGSTTFFIGMRNYSPTGTFTYYMKNVMVFDLTQMFGSTIAEHIFGLNQASAGAGVAFFKTLFPKPYYAYNAGELKSVKGLVSHDMVGFNAWDEEWEVGALDTTTGANATDSDCIRSENYIRVVPSATYYVFKDASLNFGNIRICRYDANKNFIDSPTSLANATIAMTENTHYVRFYARKTSGTVTYSGGICINLSWDGSRDGEYEAYQKWSYPLDSGLELRGIPKLDASNNLYYDGDTYESDGTVTRKYGVVDLGTLTQTTLYTGSSKKTVRVGLPNPYIGYPASSVNFISEKYQVIDSLAGAMALSDPDSKDVGIYWYKNDVSSTPSNLYFVLNTDDSPSGSLVYELATPTTETADSYNGTQIVDDFGTEEFVLSDSVFPVPVGHNTDYPINLKAKVEMMPNSPSGDGDYIVRQTNGVNEYIAIANSSVIQNIIARLEALEG